MGSRVEIEIIDLDHREYDLDITNFNLLLDDSICMKNNRLIIHSTKQREQPTRYDSLKQDVDTKHCIGKKSHETAKEQQSHAASNELKDLQEARFDRPFKSNCSLRKQCDILNKNK